MKPAPIVDAVTAVLIHGGELYLTRRERKLSAFPGYQAFPGGKVDRTDSGEPLPQPIFAGHDARLIRALSRELDEELGFDLIANTGQIEAVRMIGIALTPPAAPVRFNTHFYRIDLRSRPDFTLCAPEIESGAWASARHWMSVYEQGELLLAPPTQAVVRSLAADPASTDAGFMDFNDIGVLRPLEALRGVRQFFVRSNTLPPAIHTNCFLIGDAQGQRILVDPSPNSREELERLYTAAGQVGFDEVFLTHHHPDHRQYADEIARRAGVPLGMSAWTLQHLRSTQARYGEGPGYGAGLAIKIYAGGDVVTHWLGQPVRALSVPGHDEGQLALMPDNRAWCIVGDLIQGVGTVVIAPPEGDMRKYFATLEQVIALDPRVIYPSHGLALGGVHYLEQALQHRRMREEQIKGLFSAGRSMDEMLAEVYRDVDPRLLPLARINIESHLAKLREEGTIAA
jgi:glyoxylase-like metal-dependent hydrolase (beta-lactamase superfamily II)/8-oxo-dGTP pyrophosphatase MutT (NUDIX family)